MVDKTDLVSRIEAYEKPFLSFLRQLVEIESPTTDREAVNEVGKVLIGKMKTLGASVEIVPSNRDDRGDHIVARWPGTNNDLKPVLVIAHMDTVWNKGTLKHMPFRVEDNKVYGPGVFDMKGAIACFLMAVEIMQKLGKTPRRPVTCLFNSDEEMNSWTSRDVIEREAKNADSVLILEGGVGEAVITSRKGILYFKITAKGKAAHAGMDHEKGVNAIEEIAHQILTIQKKTNYERGTTVSCGIVKGGTRTNVIPEEAVVEVDARVENKKELERLIYEMESLQPALNGSTLNVYTLVKRPPLDRTEGVIRLYRKAKQLAHELGFDLPEASTGAISDGNLTAALGIPTLDGLGPVGGGAHSVYEHIEKDKVAKRIALLIRLLEEL